MFRAHTVIGRTQGDVRTPGFAVALDHALGELQGKGCQILDVQVAGASPTSGGYAAAEWCGVITYREPVKIPPPEAEGEDPGVPSV